MNNAWMMGVTYLCVCTPGICTVQPAAAFKPRGSNLTAVCIGRNHLVGILHISHTIRYPQACKPTDNFLDFLLELSLIKRNFIYNFHSSRQKSDSKLTYLRNQIVLN
jgi:hypothetical protein